MLENIKAFVLDMDGTIYLGNELFPFTKDFLSRVEETGYRPDEIAIVGDRLYTDIAVADQSEVTSILVLSGESTLKDVENGDVKPDVIVKDLSEITREL